MAPLLLRAVSLSAYCQFFCNQSIGNLCIAFILFLSTFLVVAFTQFIHCFTQLLESIMAVPYAFLRSEIPVRVKNYPEPSACEIG